MNKNTGTVLLVIVIIQTLLIGWLLYDRHTQTKEKESLKTELEEVSEDKEKVESELEEMYQQYEELKTDNEEVNAKLAEEQEKIENLMAELKTVKRSERNKIKQLEKETETLKRIMKGYIRQIDSLNTMNQELTAENVQVKQQYETVVEETKELETERDSLSTKVKKAAKLQTHSISPEPLNRWGRDTQRSGWVKKIRICFNLAANELTYTGSRTLYTRIADPDGRILTDRQSDLFEYEGENIAYSGKREINYQGKDTRACIFWNGEDYDNLKEGMYTADIYTDGHKIGTATFELK